MTQTPRSLGSLIREQRSLARLSLRELAQLARVSNAYLSQVERGLHEPSVRVLTAVAEALHVPVEYMVTSASTGTDSAQASAVAEAIRTDPWLNAEEKQALLTMYNSLVGANARSTNRKRASSSDDEED